MTKRVKYSIWIIRMNKIWLWYLPQSHAEVERIIESFLDREVLHMASESEEEIEDAQTEDKLLNKLASKTICSTELYCTFYWQCSGCVLLQGHPYASATGVHTRRCGRIGKAVQEESSCAPGDWATDELHLSWGIRNWWFELSSFRDQSICKFLNFLCCDFDWWVTVKSVKAKNCMLTWPVKCCQIPARFSMSLRFLGDTMCLPQTSN